MPACQGAISITRSNYLALLRESNSPINSAVRQTRNSSLEWATATRHTTTPSMKKHNLNPIITTRRSNIPLRVMQRNVRSKIADILPAVGITYHDGLQIAPLTNMRTIRLNTEQLTHCPR